MTQEKGLQYFPIALFSSVMGVSGVAISLRLVEDLWVNRFIASNVLTGLATFMFIINAVILIYRLAYHLDEVKQDYQHPLKMNFFGAISISLLLLAVLYYNFNETLSFYVWLAGAILQVGLTLKVLTTLIWERTLEVSQFNAAWVIPIVGNIVVPLAGVLHVDEVINWIFFSIGISFSVFYFTIFIFRMFFYPTPPAKLRPTLFILLAPPGVGFVSYIKLAGNMDAFAYILYGVAFYIGMLFIYQIKRFIAAPFSVAWWAFLFPSAAVTNATIYLYEGVDAAYLTWLIYAQVVALLLLTLFLLFRTIQLAINMSLFTKER